MGSQLPTAANNSHATINSSNRNSNSILNGNKAYGANAGVVDVGVDVGVEVGVGEKGKTSANVRDDLVSQLLVLRDTKDAEIKEIKVKMSTKIAELLADSDAKEQMLTDHEGSIRRLKQELVELEARYRTLEEQAFAEKVSAEEALREAGDARVTVEGRAEEDRVEAMRTIGRFQEELIQAEKIIQEVQDEVVRSHSARSVAVTSAGVLVLTKALARWRDRTACTALWTWCVSARGDKIRCAMTAMRESAVDKAVAAVVEASDHTLDA